MTAANDGHQVTRAATIIADKLRSRVVRGDISEGEQLPSEQELVAEFKVSRPTLREAIRVLESESLVLVRRGSRGGIEVSVPRIETAAHYAGLVLEYQRATVADVFSAACAIEAPCAAIVANGRSDGDLRRLWASVKAERTPSVGSDGLLARQNDFHRLVVEIAGNATLKALSDVLRHIIEIATEHYSALQPDECVQSHGAGTRAHTKLVRLIEDRDADGADALWRRHIFETGARLREAGIANSVLDLLS